MKRVTFLLIGMLAVAGLAASSGPVSGKTDEQVSPIYGIAIPPGCRDWKLISIAHEEGSFNDLRAQLGNDIAIEAYRKGTLPFPDGAIIAAIHWKYVSSEVNNKAFGRAQSFVAGPTTNIQFMVKDSKKYAATGGWGFADFTDGKPANEAMLKNRFPCHEPLKAQDYVFTHYAPLKPCADPKNIRREHPMTNPTVSEAKTSILTATPIIGSTARRLPSQEIEIPTFTKGEPQCQTLQIAEKELKGQAA